MSNNRLISPARGPGRKRKLEIEAEADSSSCDESYHVPMSSSCDVAMPTSPVSSMSDEDGTIELDFTSGNVAFHAKRHKMAASYASSKSTSQDLSLPVSQGPRQRQNTSRDQLPQSPSGIIKDHLHLPSSQPQEHIITQSASSLPLLTPISLAHGVRMPADTALTPSENACGYDPLGLLKQPCSSYTSATTSSSVCVVSSVHNVATNITSLTSSTHSSTTHMDTSSCSSQAVSVHVSAEDKVGVTETHTKGDLHVDTVLQTLESDEEGSAKSNILEEEVEHELLPFSSTNIVHGRKVLEVQGGHFGEGSAIVCGQQSSGNILKPEKQKQRVRGLPNRGRDKDANRSAPQEGESMTLAKTVESSRDSGAFGQRTLFGGMVPRSVVRRQSARKQSHSNVTANRGTNVKGTPGRCERGPREVDVHVIGSTGVKPEGDVKIEPQIGTFLRGPQEEGTMVLGIDGDDSSDKGMDPHRSTSMIGKVHDDSETHVQKLLQTDNVESSMRVEGMRGVEEKEQSEKEGEEGGASSSDAPLPGLPGAYSGLEESGLSAIDLFPTDEEFGVETIRRRRALISADKEGRDSLLKEATRKLSLKAKKRKRKTSDKAGDGAILGSGLEDGEDRRQKRVAPNFFVAIQVSNPEIHKALQDVQQTVMAGDEKLKDAMVPIPTLHLTIMVMHLANDDDVERAKLALMECHRLLGPKITSKKLNIWFHGLGHFNNQVMFAKIKDIDGILDTLYDVADTVENCYRRYGIHSTGERGFKPHLTVMKLSRAPSLRKKGVRRIKSDLYRAYSSTLFGNQPVSSFQLCSINKPKSDDGYYCKALEVHFDQALSPVPDQFDLTDEPIREPLTSTIIEEESKEPLTDPVSSSCAEEEPKQPITDPVTPAAENSDNSTSIQVQESHEAKESTTTNESSSEQCTDADKEGSKQPESEPV